MTARVVRTWKASPGDLVCIKALIDAKVVKNESEAVREGLKAFAIQPKKNKITAHDMFHDGGRLLEEATFTSLDELFQIRFVRRFLKMPGFFRYSKSGDCLMAEFNEGYKWWVVGCLKFPEWVNLPKWEYKSHSEKEE